MSLLPSALLPHARLVHAKQCPRTAPSPNRSALGRVDLNWSGHPANSIPRPALQPDVFAASPRAAPQDENSYRKRTREATDPPAVKRPRGHDERTRAYKITEEKWVTKWVKVFPSLVIHFEAAGERLLQQKVVKLGATVESFFSQRVTHLIVRNVPEARKGTLVDKAEGMGIKVWDLQKVAAADSLRTLLEDERLHGTRERDLSAPRPDYYYFQPGNKYTLIEDAVGRHRPIMIKEYHTADWPALHDSFLRISAANVTETPIEQLRARAWSLYVEGKAFGDERPPAELRRATSMRNLTGTPSLPQAAPYQAASGNSVIISSHVASTANANPSPMNVPAKGPLSQMSRRVQVLKCNAAKQAMIQPNDIFAPRRASTGAPPPQRTFMTQDQVVKMLQQARKPAREDVIDGESRIANHHRVYFEAVREDTGGYCENCRLKFADLSIVSWSVARLMAAPRIEKASTLCGERAKFLRT